MNVLLKLRWVFVVAWVAMLAVLVTFQPDMGQLVRDKGDITIPDGYSSVDAKNILARHDSEDKDSLSAVLVFHSQSGIGPEEESEINGVIASLKEKKSELGIADMTVYSDSEEVRKQLVSADNKTVITPIEMKLNERSVGEIRQDLEGAIGSTTVEHYLTGDAFINEDVVVSSQEGLHKTEMITVVFILVVLILVFRSIVAPLIPLITVGISYVGSAAILAYLVEWFNFPLSNFTQIFMVAVLFGIGTDYCILLLSRFKEELPNHETVAEAIIKTYQTAGRTVFFSALAVLIGFSSIGLSKFSLYRSSTGVAIGIAVLLVAFVTIVPFFMYVLGPKLFWPAKSVKGHGDSKLWGALGAFSLSKPFRALLVVGVVVAPLLVSYDGKLSFNSLNEIGEDYSSVKGFNTIADSFGPGEIMPVQVVIESDEKLDSQENLATIESISRELAKIPGVDKVRSATRPLGDPVKEFTVAEQAKQLGDGIGQGTDGLNQIEDGLGQGADGLNQIQDGLTEAETSLASSGPKLNEAVKGLGQLADGTKELQGGIAQLADGLAAIEKGMRDGSIGAGQLKAAIAQIRQQVEASSGQSEQLVQSYQALADGLKQLGAGYSGIADGLNANIAVLEGLQVNFAALENDAAFAGLQADIHYNTIKGTVAGTVQGMTQMAGGLGQLNAELTGVVQAIEGGKAEIEKAVEGQQQLAAGLEQLEQGAAALEQGIGQAANGQSQVIGKLPAFSDGLSQIESGQRQAQEGFAQLPPQLAQLQDGLGQSADGLGQISDGLGQSVDGIGQISDGLVSAQEYLAKLTSASNSEMTGFYIPSEALESDDFQQVFDMYLSTDKKVAKIDVILKYNPYSNEAIKGARDVKEAVERALEGTNLKGAAFGVTGMSAVSSDLLEASDKDYTQTVIYMIVGIAIILIVLLRSLVMPIYLIVSLLLCYFSSLALNELIFVNILGYDGTNWTMPFFGFVLLMALGVDYSIFLMDRFNEYKGMPVQEAMLLSMRNMGTVIFSAVIILGGTFAAMYPAGVLSLAQIATIVLSGLMLYAFVFLPFFVPVMVKLFGRANWFPFDRNQTVYEENKRDASL